MATITLSVSDEFKKKMDSLPHIKWPEVFRSVIIRKVRQLKKFEELVKRGEI